MIGRLTGQLVQKGADHVLLDIGGVGYLVSCAEPTLARLPAPGATVTLYTDLLVREDLLQLFGFETPHEKECYRLLQSVQGVGAKAALAITGALGAEGVARAIALGDTAALRAAPGVGPKLAQRIGHELKDKAAALMAQPPVPPAVAAPGAPVASDAPDMPADLTAGAGGSAAALSALVNLGYAPGEAAAAVAGAAAASGADETGALIRLALRRLMPAE